MTKLHVSDDGLLALIFRREKGKLSLKMQVFSSQKLQTISSEFSLKLRALT